MSSSNTLVTKNNTEDLNVEKYKKSLEDFCSMIKNENIHVQPYSEKAIQVFKNLPLEKQEVVQSDFRRYVDVCQQTVEAHTPLKNSKQFLWKMLSNLQLHPKSDVFDQLDDQDIIEIYRVDFTQLFRNLKFLEMCTYPVADLYVRPWTELYVRPQLITEEILKSIQECISEKKTVQSTIPEYYLIEIDSALNLMFLVKQGIFSPLFDKDNNIQAFLCSLRGEFIAGTSVNTSMLDVNYLTSLYSNMGDFLKERRLEKNLSLLEVAEKMKCNPMHLQKIENNQISAVGSTLIFLCNLYGTEIGELLSHLTDESHALYTRKS